MRQYIGRRNGAVTPTIMVQRDGGHRHVEVMDTSTLGTARAGVDGLRGLMRGGSKWLVHAPPKMLKRRVEKNQLRAERKEAPNAPSPGSRLLELARQKTLLRLREQ